MSSSRTETARRRDDAADGRLGRRGHDRRVEEAGRRLGRGRRDDLRDLDRQDRHRGPVAGERPAWRRSWSTVGETVEVGDRARADRDRRQARRGARLGGQRRGAGCGGRRRSRRQQADRHEAAASAAARVGAGATRRSSCGSPTEHDIDLDAGRGHRPRRARAQAGRARASCENGGAERRGAAAAHREPVPARAACLCIRLAPAPTTRAGGREPLSRMRQSIGEHMKRSLDTAATCTTWIEVDMTRVEAARAQLGAHRAAVRRARDDRRAARVPVAQREARGRQGHTSHDATCTSASRSRSARTG